MCQSYLHMPTSRSLLALFLGALLSVGCAAPSSDDAASDTNALSTPAIAEGSLEAEGVLLLANDRNASIDVLTTRTKLTAFAAKSIVAGRTNGGAHWFATVAEVAALPGVTADAMRLLLADAEATGYVDEGELLPPAAAIDYPTDLAVPLTADLVTVQGGFDGLTPENVIDVIRSRVPNTIAPGNEQFLRNTITTSLKSFTLAVNNVFIENTPAGIWLRNLHADEITMLGTMSSVHPTALMTKKNGVESYWVRSATGYEPIDWATYHYPVLMRAHIRLETDPAGAGVRIFYPACPLKVLERPTGTVEEG